MPIPSEDDFMAFLDDVRNGHHELMMRAEDVSFVGTSLMNAAWLPADAFGSMPESATVAQAHRGCARAVASGTHGISSELRGVADKMWQAFKEYEMNEAVAAARLRQR